MTFGIIVTSDFSSMIITHGLRQTINTLKGLRTVNKGYDLLCLNPQIKINPVDSTYVSSLA